MKNIIVFFILFGTITLHAQTGFKWQGVAKDAAGNAVTQPVTLAFTILKNNTAVYAETQAPITPSGGLLTATVGAGTPTLGNFSDIHWPGGPFSLNVKMKIGSGSVLDMGTSQISPVPLSVYTQVASFDCSDLGLGINDGRPVGAKPSQRALVHDNNDILIINYDGDFEGGVRIQSSTNIDGSLNVGSDLNVGSWENHQITLQNGRKLIQIPKDPDGGVIFTTHSDQINPRWEFRDLKNNKLIARINAAAEPALDINGRTKTKILEITGADIIEKANSAQNLLPGEVVVWDASHPNSILRCEKAYDGLAVGVVSGAGDIPHGIELTAPGFFDGNVNVAIAGRVLVKVTGKVSPGDLLTTSTVPGHAMKAKNRKKSHGAVIGKALTSPDENGLVLMIVNLQ